MDEQGDGRRGSMSTINNGGPAFPHHEDGFSGTSAGMTLRDYFAAKELGRLDGECGVCDAPEAYERVAMHCYRMADAMLAAREGQAQAEL